MAGPMIDLSRLERATAKLEQIAETLDKRLEDHETRLRDLEKVRWLIAGGSLVVGSIAGYVSSILAH